MKFYAPDGRVVKSLLSVSNTSGANVWKREQVALSRYAGRKLRLEFAVTTDSARPTSFFVDDVALK